MSIKLIALDMDGTLLTSDKRVSAVTRAALEACIQKGVCVVPATGRMYAGIPAEIKSIQGIRYAIMGNGAIVEDLWERRILVRHSIFWKDALATLETIKDLPVMYDAQIQGTGKADKRFLRNLEKYITDPEVCRLIRSTREEIPDVYSYIEERQYDVDKINVSFPDEITRSQVREKLSTFKNLKITSSVSNNLELNASAATKGNGLSFLTGHLKLGREHTMACGDAENDISMLKQAGIAVAMGNASDHIKEQADFVTASNDEDGVAAAIERFVL